MDIMRLKGLGQITTTLLLEKNIRICMGHGPGRWAGWPHMSKLQTSVACHPNFLNSSSSKMSHPGQNWKFYTESRVQLLILFRVTL